LLVLQGAEAVGFGLELNEQPIVTEQEDQAIKNFLLRLKLTSAAHSALLVVH
jgi:hypothetical protein